MKKQSHSSHVVSITCCFLTLLILLTALGVYRLSVIPFGVLFQGCITLCIISMIALSGILGIRLLKGKRFWKMLLGGVAMVLSLTLLAASIIFLIDYRMVLDMNWNTELTSEQWQEDLDFLAEKMESMHPDLFSMVPEAEFIQRVETIRKLIPVSDKNKIKGEFLKLLALPNDAHCYPNIRSLNLGWHFYPLNLFYFDDGIYITDTGRSQKDAIGSKILEINGRPAEDVFTQMIQYIGTENTQHSKNRVVAILNAEWLQAEGIITDPNNVPFTLADRQGNVRTISMDPIHYLQYFYWTLIRPVENNRSPFISNDRENNYWFEYMAESGTFYLQFNEVFDEEEEPLKPFLARLAEQVRNQPFDRFVIDLRNNGGGNIALLPEFVDFIVQNEQINQKGKLFVLIGRSTFSAAVMLTTMLQNNSNAILIGEATGQAPYQLGGGDPKLVTLPHSGLEYYIPTRRVSASIKLDQRPWIVPDVAVAYTISNFLDGSDPALEAVATVQPKSIDTVEIDPAIVAGITGKYRLSNYQMLIISETNNQLSLEITDYFPASHQRIHSRLYPQSDGTFKTDVPYLGLQIDPNDALPLESILTCWGTQEKRIYRAQETDPLPLELLARGEIDRAAPLILADREFLVQNMISLESYINSEGYRFIKEEKLPEAISYFKLNTALFPDSSNVYDSLGEAYMMSGDTRLAIENYTRVLELNPNSQNAQKILKTLAKAE